MNLQHTIFFRSSYEASYLCTSKNRANFCKTAVFFRGAVIFVNSLYYKELAKKPGRGPGAEIAAFAGAPRTLVIKIQSCIIMGQNDPIRMVIMPLWVCQNDTFDRDPP